MMQFILIIFKAKMHLPPEESSFRRLVETGQFLPLSRSCWLLRVQLTSLLSPSCPHPQAEAAPWTLQYQALEVMCPCPGCLLRLPTILLCGASNLWPALAGRSNYFAFCILFAVQASFSKKDAELSSNIVQDACGRRFLEKSNSFKASAFQISASL